MVVTVQSCGAEKAIWSSESFHAFVGTMRWIMVTVTCGALVATTGMDVSAGRGSVVGGSAGAVATGWGVDCDCVHPAARMREMRRIRIAVPNGFMNAYSAGDWLYVVIVPGSVMYRRQVS
jgi:hypothetical protein